jgi:hypothetical protein
MAYFCDPWTRAFKPRIRKSAALHRDSRRGEVVGRGSPLVVSGEGGRAWRWRGWKDCWFGVSVGVRGLVVWLSLATHPPKGSV